MIKGYAIREIRFKDGHRIGKGDCLIVRWPDPRLRPTSAEVMHRDRIINSPAATALAWMGFAISQEALLQAVMDGVCETPSGSRVEPDGVGSDGVPSWLMIHGLL
jgi:hypothetical protein